MIDKIYFTENQIRKAVEYYLNERVFQEEVFVGNIDQVSDSRGKLFEVELLERKILVEDVD